jgi:hypothetical protein
MLVLYSNDCKDISKFNMRRQSAKTCGFKNHSYYVGLREGYSFKREVIETPKVTLSNLGHFGVPQFL